MSLRPSRLLMAVVMLLGSLCLAQEQEGTSRDFKLRGPMGVVQLPRDSVNAPKAIRALLPHDAQVRLLQPLTLNPQDTLVVYDTPEPGEANDLLELGYPTVLVLRQKHVVGRLSLKARAQDDPDWVFLEAGEIHLAKEKAGVVLAFRSVGDGAGSLFLVMSPEGGKYQTVLKKLTAQGRLRADQDTNLELWDADERAECIWCPHPYNIVAYRWDRSHFSQLRKTTSCRKLSPDAMTDKPVELVGKPLDIEYTEAQQRSKNHRGTCDSRDPTREKPVRSRKAAVRS